MAQQENNNKNTSTSISKVQNTALNVKHIAAIICLVITKHHLGDKIRASSDGTKQNWVESMNLCKHFLEYCLDFELDVEEN